MADLGGVKLAPFPPESSQSKAGSQPDCAGRQATHKGRPLHQFLPLPITSSTSTLEEPLLAQLFVPLHDAVAFGDFNIVDT